MDTNSHNPILISELKDKGYIFINIQPFNRLIDPKHVKEIKEMVKEIGGFLSPIHYMPAKEWFEFYPERELILESGKIINKDFSDLDYVLFCLDGQHRMEADSELQAEDKGYISTLMGEPAKLPNKIDPDKWVSTVNSGNKNWTEQDRNEYIAARNPQEETNITVAIQLRKDYGMSQRCVIAFLNFQDNYKKSYQVEYMRHPEDGLHPVLKGTPENRKRGLDMIHAVEVGFRNFPSVLKNMAIIEFISEVYNEASDKNKERVVKQLQRFFMSLSEKTAEKILDTKDKKERKKILYDTWKMFNRSIKNLENAQKVDHLSKEAEEEWIKIRDQKTNKAMRKYPVAPNYQSIDYSSLDPLEKSS